MSNNKFYFKELLNIITWKNKMYKRIIYMVFPTLILGLIDIVSGNTHLDENFEDYANTSQLTAKWDMVFWGGNNENNPSQMTMSISLSDTGGAGGSKGMLMEIAVDAGVTPNSGLGANWEPCIYGITGYYTAQGDRTDLTNYSGIRLWIKPLSVAGNKAYFKLNLLESTASGGEKWMSPKVQLDTLDVNGQYVYFDFKDFYEYYTGSGEQMDRTSIKISFLFLSYDSTTTLNSSAAVIVDDITVTGSGGTETAILIRPPYLQNVTQNSVDIMWGSSDTTGVLYWGDSYNNYPNSISSIYFADNAGNQVHKATITGLKAGQTIYYFVQNGIDSIGWNDPDYHATTAPSGDASFRFIVYGDSRPAYGRNPDLEPYARVLSTMIPHDPDIVLHTGDIAREGYLWEFNDFFFTPTAPLAKNTPIFTTLGNHELPYGDVRVYENDVRNYRDVYSLPHNNSESIEDYYSFDYGSVHFVSLNTEWAKPGNGYYDSGRSAAMKAWLESDLASTSKPWKVVFFHKQSYLDFIEDEGWVPIFEKYGVNIVFHGHAHNYLAHYRNKVTYVTTGGGGSPLGGVDWWGWPEYILKGFSDYHFTQIDVSPETLFVNVYDDDNILRHWIKVSADGNIMYPIDSTGETHLDDDFESYADNNELAAKWDMVYWGGNNQYDPPQVSMARSLDPTGGFEGSQAMRLDFSFQAGVNPSTNNLGVNWIPCIYGITGYLTSPKNRTDLTGYSGIRLWIKPGPITGNESYFKLNLIEDEPPGTEEKWMSPKVYLRNLNPEGEYVYLDFDDFYQYYTTSTEAMELDKIKVSFLWLAYDQTATDNSSVTIWVDDITVVTDMDVDPQLNVLPGKFALYPNYPNPFNPATTIRYELPKVSKVQLVIYDIYGREVVTLVNKTMSAGPHFVRWKGTDGYGRDLASGVYICRFRAGDFTSSRKLLLIK